MPEPCVQEYPERRRAIDDVVDVLNAGLEVYKPDGLLLWLSLANKTLPGSKSALDCIAAGETEDVLRVLDQLAGGGFA